MSEGCLKGLNLVEVCRSCLRKSSCWSNRSKCVVIVKCPVSSGLRRQCVGGVFLAQERRRHYRSISLRRTRCLHGLWLVLPGEMQGQSYAAALPRLPFVGSTSKSRLQVVPPMQTIFLRRMVLVGITLCRDDVVKMAMWELEKFMVAKYTFVRPTISNNNTKQH